MARDTSTGSKTSGTAEDESFSLSDIRELVREEVHRFIEVRGDDEDPTLEDVWVAGQPLGKIIEKNRKTAVEADKKAEKAVSGDATPGVEADETDSSNHDMLPIERMIRFRESDENHPALPKNGRESFERATTIFEHFREWSNKTPKGRTITDGIKKLLETVTGERLAWRQVYRAMDKVEEWTNGRISHETTSRHGHVLVASERPSSAGSG